MTNTSYLSLAQRVFHIEAQSISQLVALLDQQFDQVVQLIASSTGRLVVTGMGKSGLIGRKMSATFASVGTPSFFLHPAEAFHGDLGMLANSDVALAISKSGETTELLQLIPFFQNKKIPVIAICGNASSTLAKNADFFLNVTVSQEACPYDLAPTASAIATLAMGDALAMALSQAKNFQPADFASLHPGGSLGQKLLTTVQKVMHLPPLPTATPATPINELVQIMTRGGLGLVVILKNEKITGIITDGDLRRTIRTRQHQFFNLKAADFMTQNPVTIPPVLSLTAAEQLMVKRKITSLLVEKQGQLAGIVQIYQIA